MNFESWTRRPLGTGKIGKTLAGVVAGLGIGTLASPEAVTLPLVGTVPGLVLGAVGLVVGIGLFLRAQWSSGGCGCSDDCDC